MPKTADLLAKALEKKTVSEWARLFNIVPSTLTNARRAGHLSPGLAGNIALELGENPQTWMLAATLESTKEAALLDRLKKKMPQWKSTAAL